MKRAPVAQLDRASVFGTVLTIQHQLTSPT